jgi:membrane associated rhomboid family serine protease
MASQLVAEDYRWPIRASQSLSATFCEYRDGHLHAGIDIKTWGEMEVPCLAVADGYIESIVVGYHGYGRGLFLRLSDGNLAVYGHLERFTRGLEERIAQAQVEHEKYYTRLRFSPEDFPVKAGHILGYSGTSGTEHPHLHFEIRDSSNIVLNPQLYYADIHDTRQPVLDEILLVPKDHNTQINNSRFPVRIDSEEADSPIFTTGPFYTLVNTHDRANGTFNKYNIYRADLFLNDSLTFAYRFDKFPYALSDSVDVVYPGLRGKRNWRFMSMFKLGGTNEFPFINSGRTGLVNPDRISTLRYRISDIKRNVLNAEFILKPIVIDNWTIEDQGTHFIVTRSYPNNGYERYEFYSGENEFLPVAQTSYRLNSTTWMILKTDNDSGIRALSARGVGIKWVLPPLQPDARQFDTNWAAIQDGYVLKLRSDSSYVFPLSYRLISEGETYSGELTQISENESETDIIPLKMRASAETLHLTVDSASMQKISLEPLQVFGSGDSVNLSLDIPSVSIKAVNQSTESIYLKLDTLNEVFHENQLVGVTIQAIVGNKSDLRGELIFHHPEEPGKWGIYTPAKRNQWKRLPSRDSNSESRLSITGNGRFFLINDIEAPAFYPVERYQRVKRGDRLVFKVEENTGRFRFRESLKTVTLDGEKFYPDYNPLRYELSFHVPYDLSLGVHMLRITLSDYAENSIVTSSASFHKMFIPLKDNNPTLRVPIITYGLIILNTLVFLMEFSFSFESWIFSKQSFLNYEPRSLLTLISYQFLHGGWGHFMFNMLFLYVFGDNIEGSLGHRFFLIFYLTCGVGAALSEVFLDPYFGLNDPGYLIGASGSISGVLGAYALRYPRAKILTWITFIFFIEIKAVWFVGIWIATQFLYQMLTPSDGTAYIAHIGGFVNGMIIYKFYHHFQVRQQT